MVVEDTPSLALVYARQLEHAGYEVQVADNGAAMRGLIMSGGTFDAVLLDLQLPDCDGLELLSGMVGMTERTKVIVVTSDGSIDRAVQATKLGAYDFLVKPIKSDRLLTTVRNAIDHMALARSMEQVRRENERDTFHGFVGGSPCMRAVYRSIESVAQSRATVFITGESGTGKEVAAEAIHLSGPRRDKPFIAVNCGAIPEALLESELFGHRKGAFTGAIDNHAGAARSADGGTLFLDEICEMDIKLQVKLLRFLQTGLVQPVGASTPQPVDVRVVCATNRDPMREVVEGRFREDLFYRLAVIPLHLPPLRERGDDVEMIARAFLRRFTKEEGKPAGRFDDAALAFLRKYDWPGNVRELQNAVRRAVVLNPGPVYPLQSHGQVAASMRDGRPAPVDHPFANPSAGSSVRENGAVLDIAGLTLEEVERLAIERAIKDADGNLPLAARKLGVNSSTLYRKRERWEGKADGEAPSKAG
ncbi:Repressor protein luxO [Novosphingobium nitrogenifigens DSM 19370]|uniref:Repressor protein luxO n=1 Tax=Novosphingobium nitrogenifigens DSM 19370 TaxID=983920 RepID=F1Z8E5_9SPHN|nr:sigma-54 dependent transcriptional regulator [Novosphingobium nitrogenifigens]EGD59080.1 Repressor protein luxO [Novosphingobium nitrogenifigens DSM 19370]